MKTFVTAIPLFNSVMKVEAYRLRDHNSERILGTAFDFQSFGEALLTRSLDLVEKVGIEPFTGGSPIFADVNQYQLLMDVPINKDISASHLICVLPENISRDEAVIEKCLVLKRLGYRLAYNTSKAEMHEDRLSSLFDYLIVPYQNIGSVSWLRRLAEFKHLIVTDIPDMEAFEKVSLVPKTLFTGDFYSRPITKGVSQISPLKVNALQLLRQVNEIDSDLTQIAKIIERDPAISISLLRFINSPAVRVNRKIISIPNAVAILGQKEIKHWVTIAVSVVLADDRPSELTKLLLVRAKFAENLATAFEMGAFAASLFMLGLFSLLDVILEKPMHEAIEEVALDERVKKALVSKTGALYGVLEFIFAYERADWDRVSVLMIRNHLEPEKITRAFIDALIWYKELLEGADTAKQ